VHPPACSIDKTRGTPNLDRRLNRVAPLVGETRIVRRRFAVGLVATAIALSAAAPALAGASMQIAPILLDLQAPAAASTIDLTNQAPQPASIQVRVFAWTQVDGKEGLTPTNDVVASPPFATIAPGAKL
jgi:P pilus assembly chaperone PapD